MATRRPATAPKTSPRAWSAERRADFDRCRIRPEDTAHGRRVAAYVRQIKGGKTEPTGFATYVPKHVKAWREAIRIARAA